MKKREDDEAIVETLVDVRRVAKVVKGGRRFAFSACIVCGNKAGSVGFGHGKAREVAEARTKATNSAKKSMIKIPLYQGRTIHHDVTGKSGASKVVIRRAKPGTGIIAGGAMRCIFESLGVHDIVAKSIGSSNVHTMILATLDALSRLSSPMLIADRRNKKVADLSVINKQAKVIQTNNKNNDQ